jgi:hypothetical protein
MLENLGTVIDDQLEDGVFMMMWGEIGCQLAAIIFVFRYFNTLLDNQTCAKYTL